jgi:PAS domain S-box-containing protein
VDLPALHSAALKAVVNGVLITRRDGIIEWANPAMQRLTGYSPDELVGCNPRVLKSGFHTPEYYCEMWKTLLSGQVWQGETINRRKDGSLYTEEQTITPIVDLDGNIGYFIAVKQDITIQKQAQVALEQERQRLLELSKSEFAQRELAESLLLAATVTGYSLDLDDVLDQILEQTFRIIPYKAGLIALIENDSVRVVRQRGLEAFPTFSSLLSESYPINAFRPTRLAAQTRQPVIIGDTFTLPDREDVPGMEWVRSYAAAPLLTKEDNAGFLVIFSDEAYYFSPGMTGPLQAFATHAGLVLENARLFENVQRARLKAEQLSNAVLALSQTLNLNLVLHTLLSYLEPLVSFDSALVLLIEDEKYLRTCAWRGYEKFTNPQKIAEVSFDLDVSPNLRKLIIEKRAIIIPDTRAQPDWRIIPGSEHVRCWMGIPLVVNDTAIGLCGLDSCEANCFSDEQMRLAEALVSQTAIIVQNAWLFEQVRAGRERMISLSRQLVEIQENERRAIARELHDEAGQGLTSLKLGLGILERRLGEQSPYKDEISRLKQQVNEIFDNLHRLALTLRPVSLDYLGLEAAIRQHLESFSEKFGISVNFVTQGFDQRLPADFEVNLFRILQEALTNVARHAQASNVDVLLQRQGQQVKLVVEDNGVGFDPHELAQDHHLGLFGMRERAEILSGKLIVESKPGQGTTVYIEVPDADPHPDC